MFGFNLERLGNTLDRINGVGLQYLPSRCLPARHLRGSCSVCVDICPRQALSQGEAGTPHAVLVDADVCDGCALCVEACPTEAFVLPSRIPVDTLPLRCGRTGNGASAEQGRVLNCLGAIGLVELLELNTLATASDNEQDPQQYALYHGECAACPLQSGFDQFSERYAAARELVAARQERWALQLVKSAAAAQTPKDSGVQRQVSEAAATLSRRHLLQGLRNRSQEAVIAYALPPEKPVWWSDGHLPNETSRRRRRLSYWLVNADICTCDKPVDPEAESERTSSLAHVPLWTIAVQGSCSACDICGDACPEGAIGWSVHDDDGSARFLVDAWRCDGCRLCEQLCPSNAIKIDRASQLAPAVTQSLRQAVVRRCPSCAQPVILGNEGQDLATNADADALTPDNIRSRCPNCTFDASALLGDHPFTIDL